MHTQIAIPQEWLDSGARNRILVKGVDGKTWMDITFQDKPVAEVGVNGMCMLDILDALKDRLLQFEAQWPCEENRNAIAALRIAAECLKTKRSRRREERLSKV